MSNINVRTAQERDLDQLTSVFDAVARERMWIGTEPGFDRAVYRAGWAKQIAGGSGLLLVACDDNEVVGSLSAWRTKSDRTYEIGMLVKATRRHAGVGSGLLAEAMCWADRHRVHMLELLVFPHNVAAIALYQKFGFTEVERLPKFKKRQSGEYWDVVRMNRELAAHSADPDLGLLYNDNVNANSNEAPSPRAI